MDFKTAIEKRLKAKGWRASELARRAGVSKSGLSHVLNNKEKPNLYRLIRIAEAFKEPVWRIVKDAEKAAKENQYAKATSES